MNHGFGYKRIGLVALMIAAMIATAGCDPTSVVFGANPQGQNTDDQDVGTPEASETPDANETEEVDASETPDVSECEVEGTIQSVSGNTVTIDGQTYTVPDDLASQLAALPSGTSVQIECSVDANGNLVITKFEVQGDQGENEDDQGENEDQVEATETPEPNETQAPNSGDDNGSDDDGGDSSGDGL